VVAKWLAERVCGGFRSNRHHKEISPVNPDLISQMRALTIIVSVGLLIALVVIGSGPWVRPLLVALALCGMLLSLFSMLLRQEAPGRQRLLMALPEIAFWLGFIGLVLFAT